MLIRFVALFFCALSLTAAQTSALRVPPGFRAEMIADESTLTNVVGFSIDESNRVFVAQTHRHVDVRPTNPKDDESLFSVEDRARYLQRKFPPLTNESERVVLLVDNNNDGQIDLAKVFANNFNRAVDGLARGPGCGDLLRRLHPGPAGDPRARRGSRRP